MKNKHQNISIIAHSGASIEHLSEDEKRVFYTTLLARVLELHRKQREEAE